MLNKKRTLAAFTGEDEYRQALLDYATYGPQPIDSPPWWLTSDFWGAHWLCDFGEGLKIEIDWNIRLSNGAYLSEPNKASHALRTWLCVQSHHSLTNGYREAPGTAYTNVGTVVRLIDYFLLNQSHDELIEHGFSAISGGELTNTLINLGSARDTEISIYKWTSTLSDYLDYLIEQHVTIVEMKYFKEKYPLISVIGVADQDRLLVDFDDERIIEARVALMKCGYYRSPYVVGGTVLYVPDNAALSAYLYRGTLNGKSHKTKIPELCFGDADIYFRELPSAYVRYGSNNQTLTENALRTYARRLKTLSLLQPIKAAPTATALSGLEIERTYRELSLARAGRFKSVPTKHMLFALERAISFFIENADDLFDSFVAVVKSAKDVGLTLKAFEETHDLKTFLTSNAIGMGIEVTSLRRFYIKAEDSVRRRVLLRDEYYDLLRKNHGLLETLLVLYGAIAITLGLLSARRRSEITSLVANNCVDDIGTSLLFKGAKTGLSGNRQRLARPIPPIVVQMIKRICKFQDDLIDAGVIEKHTYLFALPQGTGSLATTGAQADTAIDYFLDYVQMPSDSSGCRYYIRFHQTRRFLPQMFMDSGIDGSTEILQWFLNHTDREQVWAYILEVASGDAINQAAAQTATAQLRAGNSAFDELADHLYQVFKVRDFWAMTEDEVADYILMLEERGDVKVQMEFFDTLDGRRHKMLIKVVRDTE